MGVCVHRGGWTSDIDQLWEAMACVAFTGVRRVTDWVFLISAGSHRWWWRTKYNERLERDIWVVVRKASKLHDRRQAEKADGKLSFLLAIRVSSRKHQLFIPNLPSRFALLRVHPFLRRCRLYDRNASLSPNNSSPSFVQNKLPRQRDGNDLDPDRGGDVRHPRRKEDLLLLQRRWLLWVWPGWD